MYVDTAISLWPGIDFVLLYKVLKEIDYFEVVNECLEELALILIYSQSVTSVFRARTFF